MTYVFNEKKATHMHTQVVTSTHKKADLFYTLKDSWT